MEGTVERALRELLGASMDGRSPAPLPQFEGLAPRLGIDFSRSSEILHGLDQAGH